MACHATFAPADDRDVPLHKKAAKMLSILLMVAHGRMNIEDQYTWMENITDFMSCNLPTYVRDEDVHSLILAMILSTRGMQSVCVRRVEMSGTPRYLTGKFVSWIPIMSAMQLLKLASMPDR
jgi:diphthamide synthase (EF-2-diphthine--ammonia ligase)